jgi:hypothetical protein
MLERMPPVESGSEEARRQLERILESPAFTRNERMTRFLRFVVERHLDRRDDELKESVIGVEVFGRRPDYNPKQDAIVRTEASRLRLRLGEYYNSEGKTDTVVIELPKGGYVPVIRPVEDPAKESAAEPVRPVRRRWVALAAVCALVAVAAASWILLRAPKAPITIAVLPLTT